MRWFLSFKQNRQNLVNLIRNYIPFWILYRIPSHLFLFLLFLCYLFYSLFLQGFLFTLLFTRFHHLWSWFWRLVILFLCFLIFNDWFLYNIFVRKMMTVLFRSILRQLMLKGVEKPLMIAEFFRIWSKE